jgi:hypothetical protein
MIKGIRVQTHVVKSSPKVLALKERMWIRTIFFFARRTELLGWMKKAGAWMSGLVWVEADKL